MHTFSIQGARGSLLAGGPECRRHGRNTTCMMLRTPAGVLAIDAGTGLPAGLNGQPKPDSPGGLKLAILFTHFHLDHVVGLPLLRALYSPAASIRLMGDPRRDWQGAVRDLISSPYWPVDLEKAGASVVWQAAPQQGEALEVQGVKVTTCPVWHPQGCLAYRLDVDGRSYVVATDREVGNQELDPLFIAFCRGADILVHDAHYLPEEYPRFRGWGHSTFEGAAAVAREAGVGRLILTHHDARRTDEDIDRLLERTRKLFPDTEAATEGTSFGN